MKITAVEAYKVKVPIKGDYRMAKGVHKALDSVFVKILTDEGITGIGDIHQGVAGYTEETVDTIHAVITGAFGPALVGEELDSPERLHRLMTETRMGNPFARSGLEMAIYDALGKQAGVSVAALLGGPARREVKLSGGIGIETPEVAAEKVAAIVEEGYRTIKVKIGTDDIAQDIARVRACRKAVGDDIAIRLDANAGYDAIDALTVVKALGDLGIEHMEQPVAGSDWEGMARLRSLGALPIMADESIVSPSDAYRLVHMGACDVIKIKITKVGGYINARKIIDVCDASGTGLVIGQGLCSSVEAAAEAQVACAFEHVCDVAEMVGPAKLKDDLTPTPISLAGGTLALPDGPGLGVELDDAKLAQYSEGGEVTAVAAE
ncbi:MAG: hypothetical protein CMM48_13355 [Rhodospirillaceae bacterium]|nr:hypothetical protein [Rhodospirillaceae bacterium]HAA91227.1 hypothetical protein [Rhodospirillaceae bacterium]